jgi:4-amino-4-deoxy-L-arabinose transferase-like glycosyltransferase
MFILLDVKIMLYVRLYKRLLLAAEFMSYTRLFVLLLIIFAICRIALSAIFPLSSDEAYHWEWSRHLDLGYYDHPPLTAYVIFIFTCIFGDTEIGVRFGAIILMTLASIFVFKLGKDVSGNERIAFWSGMLVNIVPMLNVFFVYMSTDPAAIFFWSLTLPLAYRAIFIEKKACWYLLGLVIGAGLLAKFLNILVIPAIGLAVLLSGKRRHLFLTKEPYISGIIALVVISPFIYWNATHDWATFGFNLAKRHTPQFGILHVIEFVAVQALVVSPLLFIGFIYSLVFSWRRWFRENNEVHLFFATTSSVMFVFFLLTSFLGRVGAHWMTSGYLTMCVALPYIAIREENIYIRRHARKSVIVALAMLLISYMLLSTAYFAPAALETFGSKFSKESDEIYEIHGWREIGAETERRAKNNDAIIITPSYAACSMLGFYTPSQMQTHMFGRGAIHGLNYRYWDGDYLQFTGRDALWVYKELPKKDDMELMRKSFESVGNPEEYHVAVRGGKIRVFHFVECRNLLIYKVE